MVSALSLTLPLQGKAPGLIGWWPKMAVTFIDNHDTGSSQAHWPFPGDGVGAGYAYIITHPGMPTCLPHEVLQGSPWLIIRASMLTSAPTCCCSLFQGVPCIFWEHFFDWGDSLRKTIATLIEVRKRNGIKAGSKLEILCAEQDMYVARINER